MIGESIEYLWDRWDSEENPYLIAISLLEADAGVGVVLALEHDGLRLDAQTGLAPAAVAEDERQLRRSVRLGKHQVVQRNVADELPRLWLRR
ncbi:MAG: hypothetical protein ACLFTD_13515 [Halochromatium sp.]